MIKFLNTVAVFLLASSSVFAQVCTRSSADLFPAGFFLNGNQVRSLVTPKPLPRNVNKPKEQQISTLEKSIQAVWKTDSVNNTTPVQLATLIVNISEKIGVDYQILAAVAKKESYFCRVRHNKKGGDSGCMQFTTPALTELKHQFGLAGPGKYSPGTPEALFYLLGKYYEPTNKDKIEAFKEWISSDINKIKIGLRRGDSFENDLLAGALYLKFLLSLAGNNYGTAVRNYNGSKRKVAYQNSVMTGATKIDYEHVNPFSYENCLDDKHYVNEIFKNVCALEDDFGQCYEEYLLFSSNYL